MVRLTEVFRQAAQSQIIVNAHRINQGVIPDLRRPEAESDLGRCHRGAQRLGPAALVEAAGVAASRPAPIAADRHGELSHGDSVIF